MTVNRDWIIHVVPGEDGRGWFHTHGLDKRGIPELEIRAVPTMFYSAAAEMLNRIADYLVRTGNVLEDGQSMQMGEYDFMRFVARSQYDGTAGDRENAEEGQGDLSLGNHAAHYSVLRLEVLSMDSEVPLPCDCSSEPTEGDDGYVN